MNAIDDRATGDDDVRAAILEVTRNVGEALGDEGVTVRGIAARVGVSPTRFYQHFESKAALLRELRHDARARFETEMVATLDPSSDPVDQLFEMCAGVLSFARRHPWLHALACGDDALAPIADDADDRDAFVRRASECLDAISRFDPDFDAELAALQLRVAVLGLAAAVTHDRHVREIVRRDRIDTFTQTYVRTLLRGLVQPSSAWTPVSSGMSGHSGGSLDARG